MNLSGLDLGIVIAYFAILWGAKVSSDDLISRGDFALILDELMDPFYRMPVNLYGAFDSDDQ